ncbi:hypothetical protein MRX96_004515 [Rhipicephalus microplus]
MKRDSCWDRTKTPQDICEDCRYLSASGYATHPAPCIGTQHTTMNPPVTCALAEPFNAAAPVTPRDCSSVVLGDDLLVEGIRVSLPASDYEKNRDKSGSRKRTREDSCDKSEQG